MSGTKAARMEKPGSIVNRDREWADLVRIWRRRRPDLVFVLGRRRAGKSYLLSRFAREVGGIYYQATRRTEAEQLSRLSAVVGAHFEDPALQRGVSFPDWEALFEYVTARAKGRPLLMVLDEFPYLAASAPALPSILQSLWDHRWPESRVKLVLSGSLITAMRDLEEADQPLFGRRTGRVDIDPFDYRDAGTFLPGYAVEDRLRAYGVFGGLPGHLALLDAGASLESNVAEHILSPAGRLVDEAQHLLDAFVADAQVHYSILDAIAQGERTWQGITRRVGRGGGSLSRPIRWLIRMRLLERVVPITEKNPGASKRALYRISDPYLDFWYRFVSPMVSGGMIGLTRGEALWKHHVSPRLDDYMGPLFEEVCRAFVGRGEDLPFVPLRVGEWWDADSRNQIDVVALGPAGEVLLGECKWGTVRAADVERLRSRAERIRRELSGVHDMWLAVFSARGVADDLEADIAAGRLLHVSAERLYGP